MSPRSDRFIASLTLGFQVATLAALIWIGTGLDRNSQLIQTLIDQDKAMSTTYTDVDGFSHTVQTPYQGPTTPEVHRIDLAASFCAFRPQTAPKWWDPEDCR